MIKKMLWFSYRENRVISSQIAHIHCVDPGPMRSRCQDGTTRAQGKYIRGNAFERKKKKHGGRWETDSQQARERHRETRKVE